MQKYEKLDYQEECVNRISDSVEGYGDNLQVIMSNTNLMNKTDENRLDIRMETATGKTPTYLLTIMKLNKKFQTTKFMIVTRVSTEFAIRKRDEKNKIKSKRDEICQF